ncbi:hypothetical protein BAE46_00685 [Glaciecola punicea]|uniref:AAA family ATPase n=1 Tax=Glaciecola punicea TaxID=56804 RepID=UPI000871C6D4|nr:AAA family ATPase [Glaciecola punicea]OFA33260.1 hypothetical protein BAE46_00685 [Glaciecola punicea]
MSQNAQVSNDNLVLICGKSGAGKSAALRNIKNPEGVVYLNCETGKKLPFKHKFKQIVITEPHEVEQAFDEVENMDDVHTVVVDSLTYLMDMYESQYIYQATDGQKAWGDFAQFFKRLMQKYVASSSKNVVFIAHVKDVLNEADSVMETSVPIKGALKNNGVESYFSCVIGCKKQTLKNLEDYGSDLLQITAEEKALGFKYVFQTKITAKTVNERLRGSMGMWTDKETFIDNDAQMVLDRLHEYYAD